MFEALCKFKKQNPKEFVACVKIMTFNLRCDTLSHPLMAETVRGGYLMRIVQDYRPDSIGFQEATDTWMHYLRPAMKAIGYDYVGIGRDTGTDDPERQGGANEFAPVFYRTDLYEPVQSRTFWLSDTPDELSGPAWEADCTRICSFVLLKNKQNGRQYAHFNTHLDHISDLARENGIKLILERMKACDQQNPGHFNVLTGDFNTISMNPATGREHETYRLAAAALNDSRTAARHVIKDGLTYNQYPNPDIWEDQREKFAANPYELYGNLPIDFIFVSKKMTVPCYTVIDDTFSFSYHGKAYHNHPYSDHYGVYCEISV